MSDIFVTNSILLYCEVTILSVQMASIDDTLRELEEHLKANPNDASAWNAKGVLLARKEQFGEALRCLDQATRLDPSHAEAFVNRGRVLLALGPSKAGDALRSFDKALELTPQSPTTLWDKALALRVLGRAKDEMTCLQTIIQPRFCRCNDLVSDWRHSAGARAG